MLMMAVAGAGRWMGCKSHLVVLADQSVRLREKHRNKSGYKLYTTLYHLSPCSSMVRASHWSSEGYRLYTYVTFALPSQSMQLNGYRTSHWSSEGYRLYTYVTFALPSQSTQLNGQNISLVIRTLKVRDSESVIELDKPPLLVFKYQTRRSNIIQKNSLFITQNSIYKEY